MPLKNNTLYVKGLCPKTKCEDLIKLFSKFGEVKSTKVAPLPKNSKKCHGFVEFEEENATKDALIASGSGRLPFSCVPSKS
jgi:RNA recognition motif-containing protein